MFMKSSENLLWKLGLFGDVGPLGTQLFCDVARRIRLQ
jgi:hypothetical protein